MGERLLCKQEVIGSIPFASTSFPDRRDRRADRNSFCDIVDRKHKS